jgi:exosortase/archaeosortase family protein
VITNALRIFTIVELGTRVDPQYLTGTFHRYSGVAFFGVGGLLVLALLLWLRKTEPPKALTGFAAA